MCNCAREGMELHWIKADVSVNFLGASSRSQTARTSRANEPLCGAVRLEQNESSIGQTAAPLMRTETYHLSECQSPRYQTQMIHGTGKFKLHLPPITSSSHLQSRPAHPSVYPVRHMQRSDHCCSDMTRAPNKASNVHPIAVVGSGRSW